MNRMETSDFHLACHLGQVKTVVSTLDHWSQQGLADAVNRLDEGGATGLIRAVQGYVTAAGDEARNSFQQTIKALVDFGADTERRDGEGLAAIHWAVFLRANDLVRDLLNWGVSVRRMDIKGRTPYHLAVANSNCKIIETIASAAGRSTVDISNKDGFSALSIAAQKGELEVCEKLIELGADPNLPAEDSAGARRGPTPLHFAIYANQPKTFELLLRHGASPSIPDHRGRRVIHKASIIPNATFMSLIATYAKDMTSLESQNDEGATPLMLACQKESEEQVKALLSKKVSTTTRDYSGKTALHYCVENDTPDIAASLLDTEPDLINMQDNDGYSALHLAIIAGNSSLVEFLLKKKADVAAVDNEGHTTMHWATVCGQVPLIDLLAENGADLSKADAHGAYPVHYAAQMCGTASENSDPKTGMAVLQKLLSRNVPLDVADHEGRQPLLWAASSASAEACKVLHEAGAVVEASDKDGLTALHCAASRGYTDVTEVLLERKVKVNSQDKNGCTPLFYAMTLGHTECAEILLKNGTNPSHQDIRGRSPAHCAAAKGNSDNLKLLLKYKGDIWLQNARAERPIHEAALAKQNETVAFILDQSKDPKAADVTNQDGRTCLHIAALTNNVELCNLLLQKKADPQPVMTGKDNQKLTPYDAAMLKGNSEVAEVLRKNLNQKKAEDQPGEGEEKQGEVKEEKDEENKEKEGEDESKDEGKIKVEKKVIPKKKGQKQKDQKGKQKNQKNKEKDKDGKEKEKDSKEKEKDSKEKDKDSKEKDKDSKEKDTGSKEKRIDREDKTEDVKTDDKKEEETKEKGQEEKEQAEKMEEPKEDQTDNNKDKDKEGTSSAEQDASAKDNSDSATQAEHKDSKDEQTGDTAEANLNDSDFFDNNETAKHAVASGAPVEQSGTDDDAYADEKKQNSEQQDAAYEGKDSEQQNGDNGGEDGGTEMDTSAKDEVDNKDSDATSAKDDTSEHGSSERDSNISSGEKDEEMDTGDHDQSQMKNKVVLEAAGRASTEGLNRSDTKLRYASNGIKKPDKNQQKVKLKDAIRRNTLEESVVKGSPHGLSPVRPRTTSDDKLSSGSSESGYIAPKRPKRLPQIRKPYKHEIQELVRIFESKSLAGSEINRSRKLTMYNTYRGGASERSLVQNLVEDYNMRAREKSQDTFNRAEDWEGYLKDVIYQAEADEKAMKTGWKEEDRRGKLEEFVVPAGPSFQSSSSDDSMIVDPWQRHTAPPRVEPKHHWDKRRRGSWEMAQESKLISAYGPPTLPPEILNFKYGQKPSAMPDREGSRGQRPTVRTHADKATHLPKIGQKSQVGQPSRSYSSSPSHHKKFQDSKT